MIAALAAALLALAPVARAETLAAARYEEAVERYGHFALGKPHEYAQLAATTDAGRVLRLRLGPDEVFEDLAPRRVRMATGEAERLLAIVSHRETGARLALVALRDGRLAVDAESPPVGTARRWLNPVGVADLDGDGQAEVAAVTTPHIGGTLRVYRRAGARLMEVATLGGFSNHVFGSRELGLGTIVSAGRHSLLLIPDATRRSLRLVALEAGRLVERGRCPLAAPVVGPTRVEDAEHVSVGLNSGRQRLRLAECAGRDGGAGTEPLDSPRR